MNSLALLSGTYTHLLWQAQMFNRMRRTAYLPTILAVATLVGAHFAQILAFLIPLKVIIMLGSEKIPRFFQPIMTGEARDFWIAILVALTLVSYALSILLVAISNRSIERGARQHLKLLEAAGKVPQKTRQKLRRYHTALCANHADAIFIILAGLAIAILNYPIFLALAIMILAEIGLTGWLLATERDGVLGWLRNGIRNNYDSYLQYLGGLNFLFVFLFLVVDYVMGANQSIIASIVILLLGRQVSNCLVRFSKKTVPLIRDKAVVEDLLFL